MSAPTVTGIDPAAGPAGTLVTITGTGFTEDTLAVLFGAVSAGSRFAVVSDTQVVAYVPVAVGTVHVSVVTPAGTSAASSADQYTVSPNVGPPGGGGGDAPTVASVAPSVANDNDGGDAVTLRGTGFATTQAVRFGLQDSAPQATFAVVSDTELAVTTPPGSDVVDVIVVNSYGESAATEADQFTYPDLPAPMVSAVTPAGGYANSMVTITGSGFAEASAVVFGEEAAPFTAESDTTIVAFAPEGSGTVHVTVDNAGGTSATTSADQFTYGAGGLPRTTALNVQPNGYAGWAQGNVTVTLIADPNGGYGVAKTYYTVDNGGITQYAGPFVVAGPGSHLVRWWSVDLRGNVEPSQSGYVNILSSSAVPTGLTAVAIGTDAVLLSWDALVSATPVSYKVYAGVTAAPATLVASTVANVRSVVQLATDGPHYYAVSSVDVSGVESAKCTPVGPITASAVTVPDGSLGITKFASSIVPPRIVSALPTLPDAAYPAGSLVFLSTDGKLYSTANGTAWSNVVNAADLDGTIGADQLGDGAIPVSKFAPGITTLQTVTSLPTLPDPSYPAGTAVFVPDEGRIYRAEVAADRVPTMASNTTPGGVASASSEYSAAYAAWKAFDKSAASAWLSALSDPAPWTLGYQFVTAQVVTLYALTVHDDAIRNPKSWTLEGSNDGTSWTVLDTQANVADWATGERRDYAVANETPYTSYRLNVSASSGGTYCAIRAFEMMGYESATAATTLIDIEDLAAALREKLIPSGLICQWEGAIVDVPAGWHLADGSVQGGRTLPDLRDKFVVGAGGAYAKGATGGEATHALTTSEIPSHAHAIDHDHASATSGNDSADHTHSGTSSTVSSDHSHSGTTGGQSVSHSHDQGSHRHAATVPVVRANAAGTVSATGRWGTGASREVSAGDYVADFTSPGSTGAANQDHSHGFTTGGISANHTHTLTTGGRSAYHQHVVDLPNYVGASGAFGGAGSPVHNNLPPYYALAYIVKL